MRQLLLTIKFDGRAYHGSQVQQNALSVAAVFQDALSRVLGVREDIRACSRTDAGVHANMFCVGLKTESLIPCDRLIPALNTKLPRDIAVYACHEVPMDFHPRYDCLGKEYAYRIWNTPVRDPFLEGLAYHYPYPLRVERMNQAGVYFLGTHDFKSLCNIKSTVEDTVRTVSRCEFHREGEMVEFLVAGDGFLYNMVRIMVGTLLKVSRGQLEPEQIPEILSARDRGFAGATAPAHGLYLNRVFYPEQFAPLK